jgi:sugar-specific transcriptional regulator TrmB
MLTEIEASRAKAQELLQNLLEAKGSVEAVGTRDLYRVVTGASSLDNAIDSARRAVETYDRMLVELKREPSSAQSP